MEQKILERLDSLSNEINELVSLRESLIKELRSTDLKIEIISSVMAELKDLLDQQIE